jgi:glycosyltransferase involved in cell wall biosynthesis
VFVSFLIPSVFEGVEARHLLVFYKQLADYGRNQVAFVGERAYFRDPAQLELEGRQEWQPSWRDAFDYQPPTTLEGVDYYTLAPELLAPRLAGSRSSWRLYGQLVTKRLPELESAFADALDHLSARHRIEALITFANMPSLARVAASRGLPVIHTEFGPLRKPSYAMTGYWDLKGVSRGSDAGRRLRRFKREFARRPWSLLDRHELLTLVRRTPMPHQCDPNDAPFRVGIALQGEDNAYVHHVGALDCLSQARQRFHQRDVLVRYHPGGVATYSDTLGTTDTSSSATDFILKCNRILTVNSGVALEALLLGRPCVVLGDSPFSIMADRSFDTPIHRDAEEQRIALNFLVLGYLVPGALMFDPAYTRWRLTNPPETEILRHHEAWYRTRAAVGYDRREVSTSAAPPPIVLGSNRSAVQPVLPADQTGVDTSGTPTSPVLVVYPYCLDQIGHGNIQRVLSMARHLAASGNTVDLVYQGNPRFQPVVEQYAAFRRVYRVEGGARSSDEEDCARRLSRFYGAHDLPAAHLRPSAPLTTLVRALLEAEPYHAVVATYAWTAPIFAELGRRVPLVCDVQDILHEHADACLRSTGHTSSFSIAPATEAYLWRQWDLLVAITPEDLSRIQLELLPSQRILSSRHAAHALADSPAPGEDDLALYAASDNMSNVQALEWLLERVWPLVRARRPRARLQIAGFVSGSVPETARGRDGIEVLGFRPDIASDSARAGVVVAPYLYGSGLKIKVVEAACSGKALVTTGAGVIGSGLGAGDDVTVRDEPETFADAMVALLASRDRRAKVGSLALDRARTLFTTEACYRSLVSAIAKLNTDSDRGRSLALPPQVLRRIRTVVDELKPTRVVLWGNGTHTRMLVPALAIMNIGVGLIIDGRATQATVSPEGIVVAPGAGFGVSHGDLVVLSSETFEGEMWQALTDYRSAGGWVLGLQDERRIGKAVVERLSPGARTELGTPPVQPRPAGGPAIVLWDSLATRSRSWHVQQLWHLAAAVCARGRAVSIATPSLARAGSAPDQKWPVGVTVLPVLELEGRSIEATAGDTGNPDGELAHLIALMTGSLAHASRYLALRGGDLLVLMSPSLIECFAVARMLAAAAHSAPTVVLYLLESNVDEPRWATLTADNRRTQWRRALRDLSEATGGRLSVVSSEPEGATILSQFLDRIVSAIGHLEPDSAACTLDRLLVASGQDSRGVDDPTSSPALDVPLMEIANAAAY